MASNPVNKFIRVQKAVDQKKTTLLYTPVTQSCVFEVLAPSQYKIWDENGMETTFCPGDRVVVLDGMTKKVTVDGEERTYIHADTIIEVLFKEQN
jgi:hypothetical protein